MKQQRPRWRVRIRTLMLLVIIAALVAERTKRLAAERQAAAYALRAAAEANRAVAAAQAEAERRNALDQAKGSGRLGE